MKRKKTFTKMPQGVFAGLQLDAGVIVRGGDTGFDVSDITTFDRDDIICATTGGIQISCVPDFVDLGEDIDNCPNNVLELKDITTWNCTISFTSLGTTPELIQLALGAADVDAGGKVVPRLYLDTGYNLVSETAEGDSDFQDIWWVGDRLDGGFVAVHLLNSLSTGGFSLQTSKAGKGQTSVTLTGHVSLLDIETMPIEFYSIEFDDDPDWKGYVEPDAEEEETTPGQGTTP